MKVCCSSCLFVAAARRSAVVVVDPSRVFLVAFLYVVVKLSCACLVVVDLPCAFLFVGGGGWRAQSRHKHYARRKGHAIFEAMSNL